MQGLQEVWILQASENIDPLWKNIALKDYFEAWYLNGESGKNKRLLEDDPNNKLTGKRLKTE